VASDRDTLRLRFSDESLDPGVDRSMAEFEECSLEWTWILIGRSGGGGRDSESVQGLGM
jgi:hypothetical protein